MCPSLLTLDRLPHPLLQFPRSPHLFAEWSGWLAISVGVLCGLTSMMCSAADAQVCLTNHLHRVFENIDYSFTWSFCTVKIRMVSPWWKWNIPAAENVGQGNARRYSSRFWASSLVLLPPPWCQSSMITLILKTAWRENFKRPNGCLHVWIA